MVFNEHKNQEKIGWMKNCMGCGIEKRYNLFIVYYMDTWLNMIK